MAEPCAKRAKLSADKNAFVAAHPGLLASIINDLEEQYPDFDKGAIKWFKESMEYNCLGGKLNRGLSVIATLETLVQRSLSSTELEEATMLGWCVEWLQAMFLVADDLMDGSITRRGQPCWYKKEEVGTIAVNDSFLIEACIYKLLKLRFREKIYYVELLELMHEVTYQTELGQMLDLITAPEDKVDLSKFSLAKYKCIVKYKTAFYSFYLPVALAMLMHGITEKKSYDSALLILLEMGEFFQIQDDYLDCYGDPKVIGKIGTDIQDNKCGWLIIQALSRANPDQLKVLHDNYARKDEINVQWVKAVYLELDIAKVYHDYEDESYARLLSLIDNHAGNLPHKIFTDFAAKIYKRDK